MSGAIIWLKPRGFLMSLALICWVLGGATAVGCGGGEEVPADTALVTTPVLTPTPVTSVTPEPTAIPIATAAPTSTPPGVRTPTPTFRPHRPTPQPPPTPTPTPTPIPPPSADFSVDVLDGAAPLTVNFSHTSTGEVSAVRWDFDDGSHSEETAPVHEYTTAGVFDVELRVEGPGGNDAVVRSQLIIVRPGLPVSFIMVTENLEVRPKQSVQARVTATDKFGNSVSVKPDWEVANGGGDISTDGTFTAGTLAGTFTDTIVASLDQDGEALTANADVVVLPGRVYSVVLTPIDISLQVGEKRQFSVEVLDEFGNEASGALVRWSSPDAAGSVNPNGLFTAGYAAGSFANGVRVEAVEGFYSETAVATVSVGPGPLTSIALEPTYLTLTPSTEFRFEVEGFDEFGNTIDLAFLWETTGGLVDRAGKYTAPERSGRYEITALGHDQGITIEGRGEVIVGSPEYVKWQIGPNVTPEAIEAAIEGAWLMHEYALSRGLPKIDQEITFYLYHDVEGLVPAWEAVTGGNADRDRDWSDGAVAEVWKRSVFVTTSAFPGRENLMDVVAHEVSHAQRQAISGFKMSGGTHEVQSYGPIWLEEGVAYLHANLALDRGGVLSYDAIRFVPSGEFPPLNHLETREQTWAVQAGDWYGKWAAELLASLAGESALFRYHTLLQPGTTWQEAFHGAYGMTVDEFYELFEAHREAGFPKLELGP